MESLTNLIEKLKAVDAELEGVRARMNALAVSNAKLEQERDALRQEAERLKGESKANKEAADVLRLIEAWWKIQPRNYSTLMGFTTRNDMLALDGVAQWIRSCAAAARITLPVKDEQPAYNVATIDEMKAAGLGPWANWETKAKTPAPVTSPSPDVASGAEGGEYKMQYCEAEDGFSIFDSGGDLVADFPNDASGRAMSLEYLAYLNGTSPVHQQLAEIERLRAFREEIESLRRCRDAWDAVRKWQMDIIGDWAGDSWKAKSFRFAISRHATDFKADPIEAVLELAKALEKGG